MSTITLTSDQQNAVDVAINLLKGQKRMCQLSGPAGAGKTVSCRYILNEFNPKQCIALAPTNKAVKVLRNSLQGTGIPVKTIHSFFGCYFDYDENGKQVCTINKDENLDLKNKLMLIDEASMISKDVMDFIMELHKSSNLKLLTLGDRAQLPPVDTNTTDTEAPFYKHYDIDVELTENLRSQDRNYAQFLEQLRDMVLHYTDDLRPTTISMLNMFKRFNVETCPRLLWGTGTPEKKMLKERARDTILRQVNYDKEMVLAYRTKSKKSPTVSILNKRSRELKLGNPDMPYVKGEKLMIKGFMMVCCKHPKISECDCGDMQAVMNKQCFYTSDVVTVIDSFRDVIKIDKHSFTGYKLLVRYSEETMKEKEMNVYTLFKVDSSEEPQYREVMRQKAVMCKSQCARISGDRKERRQKIKEVWLRYYQLRQDTNANVTYSYSVSVHASQGSTVDKVYVNVSDFSWLIYDFREIPSRDNIMMYLKLLYTALSRGRHGCVVF